MTRWVLASGDFTTLGGMDRANHALASYLARCGNAVRLVAHRIDPALARTLGIEPRLVPRPFGAHLVGAPLLARAAAREARALGRADYALMNGGNGAIGANLDPLSPRGVRARARVRSGGGLVAREPWLLSRA